MTDVTPTPNVATLMEAFSNFIRNGMLFAPVDEGGAGIKCSFAQHEDLLAPLMFVSGRNASGKSFVTDILRSFAKEQGFECRVLSMNNRTNGGFGRMMIFGNEDDESTGCNSVSAVIKGIGSSKTAEKPAVMILDEPDIGLSEEVAGALGEYVAQQMEGHHNMKLLVIVSHSRPFYRRLMERISVPTHTLIMGDHTLTFDEWLNGPQERLGVDFIEGFKKQSRETWRAIDKLCNED